MGPTVESEYFQTPQIGKEPPSRVLLFKWGYNSTEKGPVYLTQNGLAEVISRFERRKNPIPFNKEHKRESAYAFGPQFEADSIGLWLKTEWTDEGKELVSTGQYGFLSPEIKCNQFGVLNEVMGVALTNYPAINAAPPILLSTGLSMDEQLMSKVRPLRDIQMGLGMCLNAIEGCLNVQMDSPAKQLAQTMSGSVPEWITAISELIEQLDPEGLTLPQKEVETPVLAMMPMEKKPMEKQMSTDTDTIQVVAPPVATEAAQVAPIEQPSGPKEDFSTFLSSLTGESEPEKIKATLLAQKHNLASAEDELKALQAKLKAEMVDHAVGVGKVSAVEKEAVLSLSMEGVEAYLKDAKPKKERFVELSQKQQVLTDSLPDYARQDVEEIFSQYKSKR